MKKLIILLLCLGSSLSFGQNLVPNPSFEDMVSCPLGLGDFSKTTYWTSPTLGSPDYFNACNSGDANVPNNLFGNQNALSGNAYVGISLYDTWTTWSYREYVQVQLTQTLLTDQEYWLTFFVNLADSSFFAIKELGAYFSPNEINDGSMDTTLAFVPQIEFSDSIITDKSSWIKITGSFIATGNENYLLIGNFNRSQNTSALSTYGDQNYAYYYIDDVCVSSDSLTCSQFVGVSNLQPNESNFDLSPNPAQDFVFIKSDIETPYSVEVSNSLGQLLTKEEIPAYVDFKLDVCRFENGMLFIKIICENNQIMYKVLKQ